LLQTVVLLEADVFALLEDPVGLAKWLKLFVLEFEFKAIEEDDDDDEDESLLLPFVIL